MTAKCSDEFLYIEENLKVIRSRIAEAAIRANRSPDEVRLMAVTKTVAPEAVNAAIGCGVDLIGENRVQELLSKRSFLQLDGVETHLIGSLQTNKARQIVGEVAMIQSLDSIRLAQEIEKQAAKRDFVQPVLLEINIGRESSKGGFLPEETEERVREIALFAHIRVEGLMAIPPICEKTDEIRAYFEDMRKLFIDIGGKKIDNVDMSVLSMGMSGDYEQAVMEGATLVRIGSSIFGARTYV